MSLSEDAVSEPVRPLLRVVRGNPSSEELAALVAVVAARSTGAPTPVPVRSLWSSPQVRGPLFPRPGAWRASSLPD